MNSFINENNNNKKSKVNHLKKHFNLYSRVLKWLSESIDADGCIERILKFIKKDSHDEIRRLFLQSIKNYFYFENDKICIDVENASRILMKDENVESNVDFKRKYNQFKFSRLCNDLLLYKSIIYSCQIELIDWPSTYLSSTEIRRIFYSLMLQKYSKDESNEKTIVKEYLRQNNNLKIFEIETYKNFSCSTGLNFFHQLFPNNSIDSLVKFEGLNEKIKVFYIILFYWLQTHEAISQKFKNLNSIRAFIVSFIKYSIFDSMSGGQEINDDENLKLFKDKFQNFNDYYNYLKDINVKSLNNSVYMNEIKKKFNDYENCENKKLNIKQIHFICEFQAIFQSLALVNEYFENEMKFELIKLNKFFNGSFLYNFTLELNSRVNADLFIEELFSRKSVFSSLYKFLFDCFIKFFNEHQTKLNKVEKTKAAKIHEEKNQNSNQDKHALFIDKNNKFSCLSEE
jgi:hypothetical protein